MIESIHIERFRGIESLTVTGLGRVNVVTGKNDCGKTAFLEAASSALVGALPALFQHKRGLVGPVWSFDAFFHHSVLTDIWTWIATVSKQRSLQVFATTHSDECIRAAAHAFQSLGDDGLRLLRLDRGEHETTVAVYDRDLLLVAEADDVEVRG